MDLDARDSFGLLPMPQTLAAKVVMPDLISTFKFEPSICLK